MRRKRVAIKRSVRLPAASSQDGKVDLPANIRAFIRADNDFLIRKIDIVCAGLMDGDILRAFIWNMISVLNVRHITRDEGPSRYAAIFDFPPDSERRPINIRQLALATRLPYETVRRQAQMLVRDGICVAIPGKGIFTPTTTHKRFIEATKAMFAAVQRVVAELGRCGCDFDQVRRGPRQPQHDLSEIVRAVIRIDADYTLDVVEMIRPSHDDDTVAAVVFTAVLAENTRHVSALDYAMVEDVAPDHLRRPVSILAASTSLNIPYATARRLLVRMAKAGRLVRVRDGYIVPAAVHRELEDSPVLQARYARLMKFVADLHAVGMPLAS